ncbi:baseplate J/gp47 family protein [Pandoraea sp.]|uniref:baseplate assembly protein n=1 Tax=Pandoraea sp. TaxID=1883445 RepID=UPI001206256E|nr:baseplate J/gp47 family protein [Pandoraea sp.]TAL53817.1 MAG: baseplate assembly protein [Pandoraea sp.]TAM17070.1 MAG: baseplate assembly protein [Pandoraea sp.]
MTSVIDLSQLPPPEVIETLDYETILAARKAALVARYPAEQQPGMAALLSLESEPLVKHLEENAYRELLLRQRINEAAHAVMLAYAAGADLEQLAALFEIKRLTIRPADPAHNLPAIREEDTDLRKRIQLAPQGFSVAGPEGAYRSHALGADGRVLDASAGSPAPGEVVITILSRIGDGSAPQDLLDAVASVLRADDVRPLTDHVTVQSAQIVTYRVHARLYTFSGPDSSVVLAVARRRLDAYVESCHRLAREVTISGLYAALHVEGVERVELLAPGANVSTTKAQAPYCVAVDIEHGGVYG